MKLSQDLLKEISKGGGEPFWLSDKRAAAWKRYGELPYPTVKDEEWKYTNLKDFTIDDFDLALPTCGLPMRGGDSQSLLVNSIESLPEELKSLVLGRDEDNRSTQWSATVVQRNGDTLYKNLASELQKKGVIICDLRTALKEHAEIVEPVFEEFERSTVASKFENLHRAFWLGGTFIYVPKGVEIKEPVYNLVQLASPNAVIFPFTLVKVEPMASLVLIDEMVSESFENKQFSDGYHYFSVKEEGSLQYINIQRWGSNVFHVMSQVAHVARGAKFNSVNVGLGAKLTKANIHTLLEGAGAEAYPLGVFFGNKDQHFDFYTIQDHVAGETQSDLLFKSALKDHAQSCYQGVIRIPKEAQRSDAYQANKNLLLDPDAKARTIPKLEIIADDVRCKHSATIGTVDAEETFYLESRGLSHEEAVRMIVEGFFEQVIQRIPAQEVRKRLHHAVQKKLEGG